ncbi:TPA: capsular biosynthesis protein [Campylobacter coli]|nr:capsular biosynthesis protein [Campylobacter coli]HEH4983130.1 capsular biosynthesis protein [Campylobacter coli]HEH4989810.1 capsular biosynthesis protein [Campylobacter coli]HEH5121958.1 capsular biosynthesis protein [Campylobacter coli]HEH5452986.1 capsular biosynthesis protein [Campylobacter coli]
MVIVMSSAYCSSDFDLEFGKIPPSFLPLGGKRLYEYQIGLFKILKDKIVLTVPHDFHISQYDLEKINSLGANILRIPSNFSLGEALIYAINMNSPINDNLYILYGDTYFDFLDFSDNSLTIAKAKENYKWEYLFNKNKLNYRIRNDVEVEGRLVLSGFISVKNPYFLIKCIVENQYSFIEGLKRYSNKYLFEVCINNSWLDFGLITNYFHSKKAISTQRFFNNLKFCNDGYIIKSSNWSNKIQAEINWFKNFPKELDIYIPKFKVQNNKTYKIEYLYSNTLAELFVFGSLPYYVWENIFISLSSFLRKLHKYKSNSNENIIFNYNKKTLDRLNFLQYKGGDIGEEIDFFNIKYHFNKKKSISLQEILNEVNFYLPKKCAEYCLVHGDFCFSNIMFDFRSGFVKVFDPRGMDFDENITIYGDKDYDYAKLAHSILGLYDFIISDFAKCVIEKDKIFLTIDISDDINKIQEEFLKHFKIDKKICSIVIHLFASMLPLHADNKNRQKTLFANIFRLYFYFKDRGLL